MDENLQAIRDLRRSIPDSEMSVYRCPKCGKTIEVPTVAVADWGIPNIHRECGFEGAEMALESIIP